MTENCATPNTLAALSTFAQTQMGLAILNGNTATALDLPKPFSNQICLLEGIHVAGTTHVAQIDALVELLSADMKLKLLRDTDNAHDKWAIKVLAPENTFGQDKLGYLPCDKNEVIARLMDGGKSCFAKVVSVERKGNWNKVNLEVYLDD